MIGGVIAAYRGYIPIEMIKYALVCPVAFSFPLAPAEGLILVNMGINEQKQMKVSRTR